MKLIRLLCGICAGLAVAAILIGSLLLFLSWLIVEKEKDWSFLIVFAIGLFASFILFLFAWWCLRRRKQDEPPPASSGPSASPASPEIPVPAPVSLPVHGSVAAMGDVSKALLALNNADVPFRIVMGDGKDADLIAEWNLVDAKWRDLIRIAGVKKVFKMFLKLDHAAREVRSLDQEYNLSWDAGMPVLKAGKELQASFTAEIFQGREHKKEYQTAFRAEDILKSVFGLLCGKCAAPKPIYEYKFDTGEIKTPIINAVTKCGWTLKQVPFGKL